MRQFTRYLKGLVALLFFAFPFMASTQQITGKVVNATNGESLNEAVFKIKETGEMAVTDISGQFSLTLEKEGRFTYSISSKDYELYLSNFVIGENEELDLGTIKMFPAISLSVSEGSLVSEMDITESEESAEIVSMLTASRDEFNQTAAFDFGVARFKIRGYQNHHSEVFLNGMPMNDLDDGYVAWSIWGGLNDVLRIRQSNHTMEPSFFAFGSLGGSSNISTLASDQRKQIRASFSLTNRSYRQRAMLTYSTGMLRSGWAFSFSGSRRWSQEGYVEATFYDAYSYFASIDKKINKNHLLNLTFLNAPNERGKQSGAIQELYDLTDDHYYNSYWGYQGDKKRNSREARSFQPLAILRHVWSLGLNTTVNTSLGFQGGRYGATRLDWYNAADPRPNYYRYLPSYKENEEDAEALTNLLLDNPDMLQVDWENMYRLNQLNQETIDDVDGVEGKQVSGLLSQYIVEEQRQDPLKLSWHSNIQTEINESASLYAGLSYQFERDHNFRKIDDLLGGDFYIDLDKYAERDFPNNPEVIQNDLNNPNRILYEQDTFGYNYQFFTNKAKAWAKTLFVLDKLDAYVAGDLSYTTFYRNGLYKNGKFPERSLVRARRTTS
jgi:hypothetical protein